MSKHWAFDGYLAPLEHLLRAIKAVSNEYKYKRWEQAFAASNDDGKISLLRIACGDQDLAAPEQIVILDENDANRGGLKPNTAYVRFSRDQLYTDVTTDEHENLIGLNVKPKHFAWTHPDA